MNDDDDDIDLDEMEDDEREMVEIALELDEDLVEQLEQIAEEEETTLDDLINDIIRNYVGEYE